MRFNNEQRAVLFTAYKHGHLSDNKNYKAISELTGLTRKQISNWARKQINMLGKNVLPLTSNSPLSSIFNKLPPNMRTAKNWSTILANEEDTPQTRCHRNPKMSKARFLPEQRKSLFLAWERGFLCDHKHYGQLSEITGLTRKQISNWARTQINKSEVAAIPQKNVAPLCTIFKELSDCMLKNSRNSLHCHLKHQSGDYKTPCHLKDESGDYKPPCHFNDEPCDCKLQDFIRKPDDKKLLRLNREHLYLKEELISKLESWGSRYQSEQHDFAQTTSSSINSGRIAPALRQKLFTPDTGTEDPPSQYSSGTLEMKTSSFVSQACNASILRPFFPTVSKSNINLKPNVERNISPIKRWVLKSALKGINKLDDKKLEDLSILANTNYHDIIIYLLQNDWHIKPAEHLGIEYLRKEVFEQ